MTSIRRLSCGSSPISSSGFSSRFWISVFSFDTIAMCSPMSVAITCPQTPVYQTHRCTGRETWRDTQTRDIIKCLGTETPAYFSVPETPACRIRSSRQGGPRQLACSLPIACMLRAEDAEISGADGDKTLTGAEGGL
jgi:hypothetical protein